MSFDVFWEIHFLSKSFLQYRLYIWGLGTKNNDLKYMIQANRFSTLKNKKLQLIRVHSKRIVTANALSVWFPQAILLLL